MEDEDRHRCVHDVHLLREDMVVDLELVEELRGDVDQLINDFEMDPMVGQSYIHQYHKNYTSQLVMGQDIRKEGLVASAALGVVAHEHQITAHLEDTLAGDDHRARCSYSAYLDRLHVQERMLGLEKRQV